MKFLVKETVDVSIFNTLNTYMYNMVCNVSLALGTIPIQITFLRVHPVAIHFELFDNFNATNLFDFNVLLQDALGTNFTITYTHTDKTSNWHIIKNYQ